MYYAFYIDFFIKCIAHLIILAFLFGVLNHPQQDKKKNYIELEQY